MKKTLLLLTLLLSSLNLLAYDPSDLNIVRAYQLGKTPAWSNTTWQNKESADLVDANLEGENLKDAQFNHGQAYRCTSPRCHSHH